MQPILSMLDIMTIFGFCFFVVMVTYLIRRVLVFVPGMMKSVASSLFRGRPFPESDDFLKPSIRTDALSHKGYRRNDE